MSDSPCTSMLQGARRDPRMDYAEDEELHVFIQGDAQEGVRCQMFCSLAVTCMTCGRSSGVPHEEQRPGLCQANMAANKAPHRHFTARFPADQRSLLRSCKSTHVALCHARIHAVQKGARESLSLAACIIKRPPTEGLHWLASVECDDVCSITAAQVDAAAKQILDLMEPGDDALREERKRAQLRELALLNGTVRVRTAPQRTSCQHRDA